MAGLPGPPDAAGRCCYTGRPALQPDRDVPYSIFRPAQDARGGAPPDRPLLGIAFVVSAGIVFAGADVFSKLLAAQHSAIEVTWLRWVGFVAITLPIMAATRGRVLRSGAPRLQVMRAICVLGSSSLFVAGLSYLPLASTTTINFVSPLIVTALSIPLLGEKVGMRRWAAVAVGLIGVTIVVRPGSGVFGWAAALPVLSAACWATGVILTRRLGGIDGPWTAMSYSALIGFGLLSAVVPTVFTMPTGTEVLLAAAMAVLSTAGQFLTVLAFGRAPASALAPFAYVQLIWATTLGYAVFGNVPDGWSWLGAAVIVASGIYTAHRERVRSREAAAAARQAAG